MGKEKKEENYIKNGEKALKMGWGKKEGKVKKKLQ